MQAVLLASGTGKRLSPLTDDRPKCLVEVNGKPLLSGILESLTAHGITNVIVTTGPFPEQIETFVQTHFPNVTLDTVFNPDYATTNAITSLWLAREKITEDFLLLHSDLLFNSNLIEKLLHHSGSGVLVNPHHTSSKDFVAHVMDDRVLKIGVGLKETPHSFLLPIYKLMHADWLMWREAIEPFIEEGRTDVYAEEAFNAVATKFFLGAVPYDGFAMEVDDLEDLEQAAKQNL